MIAARIFVDRWLKTRGLSGMPIVTRRRRQFYQELANELLLESSAHHLTRSQIEAEIGDIHAYIRNYLSAL
jgi:hypothetical protein